MTQYEQVVSAIKKIGGKGTTEDILKAIDGIEDWKTKTPKASVASILSRNGSEFTPEDGVWVYAGKVFQNSDGDGKVAGDNVTERGLYFITLNPNVKPPLPGLLFKIGISDGHVGNRLKSYRASLPYNPIQELSFYQVPTDIALRDVEGQVRNRLLGSDSLGFHVRRILRKQSG